MAYGSRRSLGKEDSPSSYGHAAAKDLHAQSASASETTSRTSTAGGVQLRGPARDLGTEPELDATLSEIDGRLWHVVIAPLVLADSVAMSEAEDVSDALGVDEIVYRHSSRHSV
jgi:hypothetical protein